jgi:hypothetical protein
MKKPGHVVAELVLAEREGLREARFPKGEASRQARLAALAAFSCMALAQAALGSVHA